MTMDTMPSRTPMVDEDAIVRAAVSSLAGQFAIDEHEIETTVRHFVDDWSARARVKTYVGIIAERHARAALHARTSSPSA